MGHLSQMVAPCSEENHKTGKLNYLVVFSQPFKGTRDRRNGLVKPTLVILIEPEVLSLENIFIN